MADRACSPMSIEIGGCLAAGDRDTFVATVNDEGLSTDREGGAFTADEFPDGAALRLHAHEVAWGRVERLEGFCLERAMPFVRWSGGYAGSFSPEIVVFTGEGEPREFAADEDEMPVMCRATAERLGSYEAIIAYFHAAEFAVPPLVVGP